MSQRKERRGAAPPRPAPLSPWRRALAIIGLLVVLATGPAWGQGHSSASLLARDDGWSPGSTVQLGVRITLAPGWHTYWSNPGDAGLAPDVSLSLDGGTPAPASLRFPTPERLPSGPLMGYGYQGQVLLPFDVRSPSGADGALRVAVQAHWLVCASVCVPEQAALSLTLPRVDRPEAAADAALFAQAERAMPRPSPFAASLSADGTLRVRGEGIGPRSVVYAVFMPSVPGLIDQAAAQTLVVSEGALALRLHPLADLKPDGILAGVLSITDPGGQKTALLVSARRGSGAPEPASGPAVPTGAAGGLWQLLLAALAGGLVLNLMPCVFPVLAMKAIALGRHGPEGGGRLRRSALLYTAGILLTFLLVGALTLVLRSAGLAVGWGFQFQSPVFVAAMAFLLFGVGLNLAGLFEVGAGLIGAGQGLAREGRTGDFLTGVLAVLVATPCTAPFMGAALAAALSGPAADAMAIFACLGLGLALPSLVLGFVPGAARALPRPGAWMVVVRQFLSFPMFAATAWLLWVLSDEAGSSGLLAALCGLLLIGFGGWVHGLVQRMPALRERTRRGLGIAASVCVLAALSLLPGMQAGGGEPAADLAGSEPFSQARLAGLRAAGRPVFVDVGAAWCVTCLVNERLALEPDAVRQAFASGEVALLHGDWTSRSEGVTQFLHRFGRDGVPLYVFFPAGDGTPRVLPQVLTPGLVLQTVRRS